MWFDTRAVFLTSAVKSGRTSLNAFDNAMRTARIADFNIIRVTSIVPPGVPVHIMSDGPPLEGRGLMLPAVYASFGHDVGGVRIVAGVGIGVPKDSKKKAGVIFAYCGFGTRRTA